jgi:creatinine amidohydrolase
MPVFELASMTWEEVRALEAGAVAILPVGAIEAHGPHLPLATDGIIAEAMARRGAERLAARGKTAVVLPTVSYTCAGFAAGFPGTVSVDAARLPALIRDICASLARQRVAGLALANAHLDPGHLEALRHALRIPRPDRVRVIFPDLTQRPWGSRLTAEFKSGACHAGQFETSVVLAVRPELVRRDRMERLTSHQVSLSTAIRAGKHTFEEAGGPDAYFGDPASATPEEGRHTIDVLGSILEDAVLAALAHEHPA